MSRRAIYLSDEGWRKEGREGRPRQGPGAHLGLCFTLTTLVSLAVSVFLCFSSSDVCRAKLHEGTLTARSRLSRCFDPRNFSPSFLFRRPRTKRKAIVTS